MRNVYNFKDVTSPVRIYSLQNSYLILHDENHGPDQFEKIRLGHIYSEDLSKPEVNFLVIDEINENIESLSRALPLAFGSVLVRKQQQFLFVPYYYSGSLYEYSKTPKGWQQTNVFAGLNQQKPYSLIKGGNTRKPDGSLSAVDLDEDREYVVHNLTRGLFKYKGHIFHFIFTDINKKRVFGVEVYDNNLNHIGFSPIKSIPITNKEDNFINWTVEAVDEQGNFYFLKETYTGQKMSVMQVNSNDLKRLAD